VNGPLEPTVARSIVYVSARDVPLHATAAAPALPATLVISGALGTPSAGTEMSLPPSRPASSSREISSRAPVSSSGLWLTTSTPGGRGGRCSAGRTGVSTMLS